jgi:hypothetical protein
MKGTLGSQNWHYLPMTKGTCLTGHKQVFYSVSPILLTRNTKKRLTCHVQTTPSVSPAWDTCTFYLVLFDRGGIQIWFRVGYLFSWCYYVPVLGLLPPTDGVGCYYTAISRLRSVIRSWKSDVLREKANRKPICHYFAWRKLYCGTTSTRNSLKGNWSKVKRLYISTKLSCYDGKCLKASLPDHQTINMVVTKQLPCVQSQVHFVWTSFC